MHVLLVPQVNRQVRSCRDRAACVSDNHREESAETDTTVSVGTTNV